MDDEAAGDAALDDRQADQAFAALLSKASRTGEAWELLDFANLRLSLDDQAQSMSSDIEERLQARQNLKALAKRFKKDCAGATAAAAAAAHPSATAALDAAFAPDEGGLPGRADGSAGIAMRHLRGYSVTLQAPERGGGGGHRGSMIKSAATAASLAWK